tara:strand:- start:173 stop:1000 length:828 start_codon:yes stop_codon:yes gene_type:complete
MPRRVYNRPTNVGRSPTSTAYPTHEILAWCSANELGRDCCIQAVEQVYKQTRLSLGFFPKTEAIKRWTQDPRPVIKTSHTCSDTGGYHKCAKTIEVDDATKKLIQDKIPPCNDTKTLERNKSACINMRLGHCCIAITETTDMTAGQIIDRTLQCAQDAYPCELVKSVHSAKYDVDTSMAAQACKTVELKKKMEAARKAAMDKQTTELCQSTISEWDGGNAHAYQCCKQAVSGFVRQHSKLPSEDFVTTKCDSLIKNWAELDVDVAENWVKSALSY